MMGDIFSSSLFFLPMADQLTEFSLTSQATPVDVPGGFLDEELTLDTVNLENVLPVKA